MKKGFTLIELLVVIAIIALLSTLSVVALNNARSKTRDARRLSDIRQIRTALELYYNQNGSYPDTGGNWVSIGSGSEDYTCLSSDGFSNPPCTGAVYMAKIPGDPQPTTDVYYYKSDDNSTTYYISYFFEAINTTRLATPSTMGD